MNVEHIRLLQILRYQQYAKHAFDNAQAYIDLMNTCNKYSDFYKKCEKRAIVWQCESENWYANARYVMRVNDES